MNCAIRRIRKGSIKIISAFEQNGQGIKRFRRSERNDVMRRCLKWFNQERSDNVPVGGPLLLTIFVLPEF